MDMTISWLAVLAATVVGFVIAFVWYSDWGLVGGTWRKLTGVTKEISTGAGKGPMVIFVASLVLTAIGLAAADSLAAGFFDSDSPLLGVAVGAAAWAGFSVSTLAQHNGFEMKPTRLTVINCAYQLVLFVGMGLTVGLLQ
ncbi:DUF1761 domain-containing protein [Tsukamurella tyrosinosolvens]|uniref:DUF1761 domain-containing protein n=1 Tax=Tsukamurella tyrosinosolvens TaxID=57704 RepID=UPI000DF6793A|nr:DUF1761 domain-containing protein [Tsukamurella tyrosinosolvens]MEC4613734.1 DUF1761 domain-containing protein [Tsukamurella tyrosinosolvens]RDB47853.1 DUF1761 domain-containing protein [Tsukamurella tyrosinosolvens]